jgi:hypothetical protein
MAAPPPTPLTLHVTVAFAVNCLDVPVETVSALGVTVMVCPASPAARPTKTRSGSLIVPLSIE